MCVARNFFASLVLAGALPNWLSAQDSQPSPAVLAQLQAAVAEEAAMNAAERERVQKFLKAQQAALDELSASDLANDAKQIAEEIDRGIRENRRVEIKLVDGKEHYPVQAAEVAGYWLTIRCHKGAHTGRYEGDNYDFPSYADAAKDGRAYDIRVRANMVVSVTVGARRIWRKN